MKKSYSSVASFLEDFPKMVEAHRETLKGESLVFQLITTTTNVFLHLENGVLRLTTQREGDHYPVAILKTDDETMLQVANKEVSPMKALLFGKVMVQGDVKPLLRLAAME